MFKWKIPTRKGGKQDKLNNELNNKQFRSNAKKRAEKEPENNRRNAALNESIELRAPEPNGAPHRAPSHPAPPDCSPAESRGQHTPDQSLPPHSTYPVSATYGAPPQPSAAPGPRNSPAPHPAPSLVSSPAASPASYPSSSPAPNTAVNTATNKTPSQAAGQTARYPAPPRPSGVLSPTQPRPPPYVPPPSSRSGIYGTVPARVRVKTSQSTQVEEEMKASDSHNTSMTSTATDGSRPEAGSSSWMEWTQQLQAYVAWVNSQLRKKEGYKLVTDLRADLHSGVVLADLIEIVSGEKIAGIYRLPETAQMMRENVERVLQFMAAKRIRMHHVGSKEVIEGNLKAVMRLILALAAHYKPQSVRTSPYDSGATTAAAADTATSAGTTSTPAAAPAKPTASKPTTPTTTPTASPSAATTTSAPSPSGSSATVTGSPSVPNTPSTPGTPGTPGTAGTAGTAGSGARRTALSSSVTTPNLNVPGNRKSIGHLLEGGLTVAPLRRFPSVAGHQWSVVGHDAEADDDDGDDGAETRIDDDEPAAARPERRSRRQWGLPGPPLYENLPRSNSFASYGSERPRLQPAPPDAAEGIYDVPRIRPARVHEGPASLGLDLSRTTQTDGRDHREIVDGFSSLPRHGVRPAALDFWENMTAHSTGTSSPNTSGEFRYNTVHRMSGRRMLPKTPDSRGRGGPSTPGGPPKPCDEPEERSLGSRGEVEGSSSHGSPTTSIVRSREEAVAEWLRGTPARRSDTWARPEPTGPGGPAGPGGDLWRHSALRRSVQLEGWAGRQGAGRAPYGAPPPPAEPPSYDALLEELGRARRQLVALQELVSLLNGQQEGSECRGTNTADEFVFLKSRLQNTSEKCNLLQADLNKAKQNLINEDHERNEDTKSNARNPFHRHGFASDQGELGARLTAQERELQELRRQLADKDKAIHLQQSQFDDAIKALATSNVRPALNGKVTPQSPVPKARGSGREEMHILRDAISSLRANFRESDPNHHTLDTLEQCVAVVLDRLAAAESGRQVEPSESQPPSKRAPITSLQGHNSFTKVVYYTEKTLTPFLSSVPKQLGEITLRDFKQIFDRPGNYRFHFKSMDPEFGMVKEEISNDDEILPGFDGKLISWVVEDHGA